MSCQQNEEDLFPIKRHKGREEGTHKGRQEGGPICRQKGRQKCRQSH